MQFGSDTLLLFPCCAEKHSGGSSWSADFPDVTEALGTEAQKVLLAARKELLLAIKNTPKFNSGKNYGKNKTLLLGTDFGESDKSGKYRPAIKRYNGSLYKANNDLAAQVHKAALNPDGPRLLIVSALYGLLHPMELIQDYNLQMSDPPAKKVWNQYMPYIIKNYIARLSIKRVVMYFGGSTTYLKIAVGAVKPLIRDGSLRNVLHYDIEKGNAYHTPHNHGLLLFKDLTGQQVGGFTRSSSLRDI